jgi:hypothetical protein
MCLIEAKYVVLVGWLKEVIEVDSAFVFTLDFLTHQVTEAKS